jgi:hypothetical protein
VRMSFDASATVSKAMVLRTMAFVTFIIVMLLVGCTGSTDNGTGQQTVNTGDSNNTGGGGDSGGTNNSPGTGSGDTSGGGSTGGSADSGSGGDGATGGGSTSPGTLANLYRAPNQRLNINNCNMLANGSVNFSEVVLRLIGQSGNDINAVITLTPDSQFLAQFDQVVLTLQGAFTGSDTVGGSFSALSTINGEVVDRTQGTFDITVILGVTLLVELTADSDASACHISGAMYLDEFTDPGTGGGDTGGGSGGGDTGGGTGGDTGGGTGGDTSGGTGGGTGGSGSDSTVTAGLVIANGQFGSLQMQSQEFPEDNGSFEMTTVQFVNIAGNEMFAWSNDQQSTINIYFGLDNSNTTLDSSNSREYLCDCFPTVDLINNQVFFNNIVLTKPSSPTGSITINGTLTFPPAN